MTTGELIQAREVAAADLDATIAALGEAKRDFDRLTRALGERVGANLAQKIERPLVLHLTRAGLGPVLALQLQIHGRLASLRTLVDEQHAGLIAKSGLAVGR